MEIYLFINIIINNIYDFQLMNFEFQNENSI
jgi:hypothetical protein